MMKPAYFGKRDDSPHLRRLDGPAIGRILSKRKVAAAPMIIINVRSHLTAERSLIEDDDVVETLSANRADEALDIGCLPGRSERGENFGNHHAFGLGSKDISIDTVTIPEQVSRRFVPRKGLQELCCSPFGGRMFRHVKMDNAPAIMSQDKKHIQDPESDSGHHEEVYGNQLLEVVFQERPPGL